MNYLLFAPLYQERVWGGRSFESALGRVLPDGKVIGESWEIVDRPEAVSVVSSGLLKGKSLRCLIEEDPAGLMGPQWPAKKPFPILVKWLDAQERLSLQVHPPKEVAPQLGGEPKTEVWYIAGTAPEAAVLAGLTEGTTRAKFEKALSDHSADKLLHRFLAKPGDCLFVPSGRVHAIDGGCLILEVQQNSDTTYRVYDWGRVGLDGKPRPLHVAQSLASIHWDDTHPEFQHPNGKKEQVLADAPEFRMTCLRLKDGETIAFGANEQPRLLAVVDGAVEETLAGGLLKKGDNALLPYRHGFAFRATGTATLLLTDRFA